MPAITTLSYPANACVVFRNPSTAPLYVQGLGKTNVNFAPGEYVAVLGNPLLDTWNPQQYNSPRNVVRIWDLLTKGKLEVWSTPDQPDPTLFEATGPVKRIIGTEFGAV